MVEAHAAEAIRQALYTYARGVDRRDPDLIAAAFWPDAVITLGSIYSGAPAGFVEVAMGFMGMFAATRHDIGNVLLVPVGDGRIAYEAYVRTWHWQEADGRELVVLGRYLGHAEQRDGVWRSVAHTEAMDWGETRAVDAGWFEANGELPKGRRDRDDESYRWLAAR
ncbi:ketosteroid isomerase-like protein [Polymorphobacter multimanifer]|uniref:Ketosteroid isomerase-like protein n=2 Tax=Polymorphobacter multimanifer TaxID=1070431 RepID=A0A841LFH1_9SPHN|nr:nuclear transport factor 2 family protein [Polymorphobacter multimanifer]MBB6227912.1 ketosteroid isomerase-like protein [Polymorphobacter multimanifer]